MARKDQKDEYGLTRKERVFCDEYLLTGNKSASARKAGVKPNLAGVYASRMLKNDIVATYLTTKRQNIQAKAEDAFNVTVERIIKELAAIALLDPGKMYDENGELLPINKMDEMTRRALAGIDVLEKTDSDGALIGYLKKVRTSPKVVALELLGRHFAMWGDKDSGALAILNINIITNQNQLDNPPPTVIEHG